MKRNAILNDGQEFVRFKMAIDQNVLTPEVRANGMGGVDMKRPARFNRPDRRRLQVQQQTEGRDIFDASYLPTKPERLIRQ